MTSRWNPNNPAVAGSEWFGAAVHPRHPGPTAAVGTTVTSTVTENVDQIIPWSSSPTLIGAPALQCDIYDLATVGTGWPGADLPDARRSIKPAANSPATPAGGGAWNKLIGGVLTGWDANAWQTLDDNISDADPVTTGNGDGIQYNIPNANGAIMSFAGGATFLDGATGTAVANLVGLRIASVDIVVGYTSRSTQAGSLNAFITVGGNDYYATAIPVPVSNQYKRATFTFPYDPRTGLPWTNTAAQTFVNVASSYFGFFFQGTPGTGYMVATAIGIMFHTVAERRVATADGLLSTTAGWLPLTCRNPATGITTAWTKTAGHSYLLAFHTSQIVGGAGANLAAIDTSTVAGHETDAALFPGSVIPGEPGAIPTDPPITNLYNLSVLLGSTPSVDSQPYTAIRADQIGGAADQKLRQAIGNVGAFTYGTATVVVQTTGSSGVAAQDRPLSIALKNTADNATLAGPFVLPAADVPADGKWHVVTVRFTLGATLTASQGVYLELSSTGSTVPWLAVGLLTRTPPVPATDLLSIAAAAVGINGAFGGTIAGVADPTLDYPWNIGTVPTQLTGLTASVATKANIPTLTGTAAIPAISYVALAWNASSLGTSFGYYEIERYEPATDTFVTIARITKESSAYFNDFETPRNTTTVPVYLARVVRADGQPSNWVFVVNTITIVPTHGPCDLVLASNFAPDLAMAVQDETPYKFVLAESAATVVQRIAGRPFPVQFQPNAEGQGDIFARNLILATNDPSVTGETAGRAVFDDLVALARTPLPYVAVTDGTGRRWLCGLTIGDLTRTEPGGDYQATVTFNEVANLPTTLTIDVPWAPSSSPTLPAHLLLETGKNLLLEGGGLLLLEP